MAEHGVIIPTVRGFILCAGKVLLLQRSPQVEHGPGQWEFPGGKLEFGESLQQALLREVEEETGLQVQVGRLLYAAAPVLTSARQAVVVNYQCSAERSPIQISSEHQDFLWAGRQQLVEKLGAGAWQNLQANHVLEKIGDILL